MSVHLHEARLLLSIALLWAHNAEELLVATTG
jgi:hypothetical protein